MIYVLYGIVILINLVANTRKKSNTIILLLSIGVLSLIWTGNIVGPDIENYISQYNYPMARLTNGGIEIIYNYLLYFFSSRGVDFYVFRYIISFAGLAVIFLSMGKIETKTHMLLVLYALSQFFLDGIQIRNFLALPFFILAIITLIKGERHWKIKYVCFVLLATLIHVSFLIYFIFLLIPEKDLKNRRMIKIHGLVSVILCMVFFFGRQYLGIIVKLISSIDLSRATSYSQVATNMGSLICILLQFAGIGVSYYNYWKVKRHNIIYGNMDCLEGRLYRILWINFLAIYLLPFSMIQLTFYRLIRNLVLFNFSSSIIAIRYYPRKYRYKFWAVLIVYLLLWQVCEFHVLNQYEVIVEPFFVFNKYIS